MKKIMLLIFTYLTLISAHAQWHLIETNTNYDLYSVFFLNDSTGFVTGYISPYNVVRKTTDYGITWTTVYQEEANYFYDVYFPSDSVGYVGTHGNVLKTIDGGETWFYPNPDFEGSNYRSLVFQDNEIGFACYADGGASLMTTIDGGYTWNEDYTYGGREILIIEECEIRVISGQYGKSNNCWETYESSYFDLNNRSKENFAMTDSTTILACGLGLNQLTWENFGFIAKSPDDGESWVVQDFPTIYVLRSIVSVNETTAYCVGQAHSPNEYSFLKTIDGGESWFYQEYELMCDVCTSPEIRDVYCPSENVCYAIRGGGGIWRTINGGGEMFPLPVGVDETVDQSQILLYPVPTNGMLELVLPNEISSEYCINILDNVGRIVLSRSLKGKNIRLDLSSFPNGSYVIQVISDKSVLTKAFVKQS